MSNNEYSPKLPEHYRPDTILGMMPDRVIFPCSNSYVVDKYTRTIYLDTSADINSFETKPSYFGNDRTALMKVLNTKDGDELEGYIADLRHIQNSGLFEREITQEMSENASGLLFEQSVTEELTPLLGAVFYDIEGKEIYIGDPRVESHAVYLAVQLDTVQEELDPETIEEIQSRLPSFDVGVESGADPNDPEFFESLSIHDDII